MLLLILITNALSIVLGLYPIIHQIAYKFSFKPPQITASDHTIPFWTGGQNVEVHPDFIRLSGPECSETGRIWCNRLFEGESWTFESRFRISGIIGGYGMAFWFTKAELTRGSAFGASSIFEGLSVVLDTYSKTWKDKTEMIGVVVNNGTHIPSNGGFELGHFASAAMLKFRNSLKPCTLRVTYLDRTLIVEFKSDKSSVFTPCARIESVDLPRKGYFGISVGSKRHSKDSYDLYSFVVHKLIKSERKSIIDDGDDDDDDQRRQKVSYHRRSMQLNNELEARAEDANKNLDNLLSGDIQYLLDRLKDIQWQNSEEKATEIKATWQKIMALALEHSELDKEGIAQMQSFFELMLENVSPADLPTNLDFLFSQLDSAIHGKSEDRLERVQHDTERMFLFLQKLNKMIDRLDMLGFEREMYRQQGAMMVKHKELLEKEQEMIKKIHQNQQILWEGLKEIQTEYEDLSYLRTFFYWILLFVIVFIIYEVLSSCNYFQDSSRQIEKKYC
ncbi:hypothetical protein ACOME3_001100 [Neoechinorhynchus agilis]